MPRGIYPKEKRAYFKNPELQRASASKGGRVTGGKNSAFIEGSKFAKECGRKGGINVHKKAKLAPK